MALRTSVALLLAASLSVVGVVAASPAHAGTGTYAGTVREAARSLKVAAEVRTGYDRDLFTLWTDADHDGCDTRDEVLIAEAVKAPTVGSSCSLSGGRWYSYYDKTYTSDPSSFDIDHMVPLAEAWDSGARSWTASTRERYANDLGDPRPLVAVTAHANRSKSDQDPAEWMPAYGRCRYVTQWVVVKVRWGLSVNRAEKKFLVAKADSCPNKTITVKKTRVYKETTDPGGTGGGTGVTGLRITKIVYDPPGSDTGENLNSERAVIKNTTSAAMSTSGWTLRDAAGAAYVFPAKSLAAGHSISVRSGSGSNTATSLYAGWGYTWNNSGDTATLVRPNGTTAQSATYTGNSTGVVTF